ncbi:MAG: VWA domain-containing protein [Gammaproteobacteria bacterium]
MYRIRRASSALRTRLVAAMVGLVWGGIASAGGVGFADPGGYGLKIYRVESALYPFIQVYFRTFDANKQPLVNLNERNIGLMVKGRSYNPLKLQYFAQSIRQRQEAIRTVIVLDASGSMRYKTRASAETPFAAAVRAIGRYLDTKRPQDEVAVLAIRDTKEGYDVVSNFERDKIAVANRVADVMADGLKTRLYDAIGAAIQMCGMTSQGSVSPGPSNYIVSCSIVVLSDGYDEGSAVSRDELNTRITNLEIPVPVYSLAYSAQLKLHQEHFKNLEAISKNSFGVYYLVGEAFEQMQRVVEDIQNILQSDYVATFRAYTPVDGEKHGFKLGVEYPSGSGKYIYESADYEAIEPVPVGPVLQQIQTLGQTLRELPDKNPYFDPASGAAPPAEVTPPQPQPPEVMETSPPARGEAPAAP